MGVIQFIRQFTNPNERAASAPAASPAPNNDVADALEPARVKTIDDVLGDLAERVDQTTAARDERVVDSVQRDRAERDGEHEARSFFLGPLKTTGTDAALVTDLTEAEQALAASKVELQRAEEDLDAAVKAVSPETPQPNAPVIQVTSTTAAYGASVALTLSAVPPFNAIALDTPMRALVYAGTAGLVFGTAAISSIYGLEIHEPGQTPIWAGRVSSRATAFAASGVMVGGLTMLRLSEASTTLDVAYAFGYAAIELGCLAYAKSHGADYQQRLDKWRQSQAERPAALTKQALAQERRDACRAEVTAAVLGVTRAKHALAVRQARDFNLPAALTRGAAAGRRAYERRIDLNVEKARARRAAVA